ncbi:MAG: hypothetical protein K0S22_2326 [Oscillospiraceae bacterium]|jgi:hypothetical protein|nr:hypothetical protein [Oscillospiraceae bacterium]
MGNIVERVLAMAHKMQKNYKKVPDNIFERIREIPSDTLKVGIIKKLSKKDVEKGVYKDLSISLLDGKINFSDCIIPSISQGRYSKYNQHGRTITRKDLPKVLKNFIRDIYPYGDTTRSTVTVIFTKLVYQKEVWIPNYLGINISLKKEDDQNFYMLFEINSFVDRNSEYFDFELLFCINLLQENCGGFEVYATQDEPSIINSLMQVDWELLPPGTIDMSYIQRNFLLQTEARQKEILERYKFIQSLYPLKEIRGTNTFNSYFGAMFENELVVLENTRSGNAIYVFREDWETLSKYSRTTLMKMNTDKITRITHTGNWKRNLQAIIESSITIKP